MRDQAPVQHVENGQDHRHLEEVAREVERRPEDLVRPEAGDVPALVPRAAEQGDDLTSIIRTRKPQKISRASAPTSARGEELALREAVDDGTPHAGARAVEERRRAARSSMRARPAMTLAKASRPIKPVGRWPGRKRHRAHASACRVVPAETSNAAHSRGIAASGCEGLRDFPMRWVTLVFRALAFAVMRDLSYVWVCTFLFRVSTSRPRHSARALRSSTGRGRVAGRFVDAPRKHQVAQ